MCHSGKRVMGWPRVQPEDGEATLVAQQEAPSPGEWDPGDTILKFGGGAPGAGA